MLTKLIQKLENFEISLGAYLATLFSIIIIRLGIESISANKSIIFTLDFFPHMFLFFISMMLTLTLLAWLLVRENIIKISRIIFFGQIILLAAPIFDLILSRGKTPFLMGYIFDSPRNFLYRYLHFFAGTNESGITYGMKLQIILACIFIAIYVFSKTKSIIKTLFAPILTYSIIFIYSVAPSLLTALQFRKLNFNFSDIFEILLLPKSIFNIQFSDPRNLFNFEMAAILFFLVIFQLATWYLIYSWKKLKAIILYNVRYLRFFLQIFTLFGGLWLGFKITEGKWDFSVFGLLSLFLIFITVFFIWLFSVGVNDIYDLEIDRASAANKMRILPQNIMPQVEYQNLNFIFLFLANLAAFILGPEFLTISLILSSLTYIYSAPPLRLRRFPFLAHLIIAASSLCAVFLGFLVFAQNQTLAQFPPKFALLILLFFTLATHIKDIKDRKADKANNVITLPTIFGEKGGKLYCGILVFLSFLFFGIFLHSSLVTWISLAFGVIGFLLTYDKRSKEYAVFGLYSVYLFIVFLLSI